MPIVEITFRKEKSLTAEQKLNLTRKVTELLVQEVQSPRELIFVIIHEEPQENFLIGGLTLQENFDKIKEEKK